MKNVIITTTNSIEGAHVDRYLGIVTTNLVVATDVFADVIASFTDFFGGKSRVYGNHLESMYLRAIKDIKFKALNMMADAVIGLHIDFDELSAQGKSMFMVAISGTAVECSFDDNFVIEHESQEVTSDELQIAIFLKPWEDASQYKSVSDEDWEFIHTHYLPSLLSPLMSIYRHMDDNVQGDHFLENLKKYVNRLEPQDKIDQIYELIEMMPGVCLNMIREQRLFSPKHVARLIENGQLFYASQLIMFDKDRYTHEDLVDMERIVEILDNLPDRGRIEEVKGGLLSSGGLKYICPNGHKNDAREHFCSDFSCGLNIKGLREEDVENISKFKVKVQILKELFARG